MNLILTVVLTLLIFGTLIAIHELGHYLVARLFKVGIREYSIGMGPKIYQKQGKYNKFTLRALPIGGYVDMVGEAADDDGTDPEDEGKPPLNTKPVWQRMLIVLAGPAMNILLGLLVMAIIVVFQPQLASTTVAEHHPDSVSCNSMVYVTANGGGFEKGDIIIAVDGKHAVAEEGLDAFLKEHGTAKELVVVHRNSNQILNEISEKNISLSRLPLKYDSETGYFSLTEDAFGFEKDDIIYTVGGTDITKTNFAAADGTAEEHINALVSAYPNTYTVGVVRLYAIITGSTTEDVSLESFKGLPVYLEDGQLKFSEDFGGVKKNGRIAEVNGGEVEKDITPEKFEEKYGAEGGVLKIRYYNGFYLENPRIVENVDLTSLSLGVSDALKVGDEIQRVGSYRTRVYTDLSYGVFNEGVEPTTVEVIRGGKEVTLDNVLFYKAEEQGILCGRIDFYVEEAEKTVGNVCYNAFHQPISTLKMTVDSVLQTFKGKYGIEALSGPVGIGEQVGVAIEAEEGRGEYLFTLLVLISLSLGICNLLPLPVLDGGRFLIYAIEGVRRKPLKPKTEQILMAISWVLVLGLMVFVMFKDVIGLFD